MRWDALFADLEGQLDSAARAELAGEVADRSRWEVGQITLADRLGGAVGSPACLGLVSGEVLRGRLERVGPDWVLLSVPGQPDAVVPVPAIESVSELPVLPLRAAPAGEVAARLDLGLVLRMLARDRAPVRVAVRGGRVIAGTIDRVGADFLELAEHELDEARRSGDVRGVRTVAFAALVVVRAG